jgi:hypothetical protein
MTTPSESNPTIMSSSHASVVDTVPSISTTTPKPAKVPRPRKHKVREHWLEDTEKQDIEMEARAEALDETDSELEEFVVNDDNYNSEEDSEKDPDEDNLHEACGFDISKLPAKRVRKPTQVYVHPNQAKMLEKYEEQKRRRDEKRHQRQIEEDGETEENEIVPGMEDGVDKSSDHDPDMSAEMESQVNAEVAKLDKSDDEDDEEEYDNTEDENDEDYVPEDDEEPEDDIEEEEEDEEPAPPPKKSSSKNVRFATPVAKVTKGKRKRDENEDL